MPDASSWRRWGNCNTKEVNKLTWPFFALQNNCTITTTVNWQLVGRGLLLMTWLGHLRRKRRPPRRKAPRGRRPPRRRRPQPRRNRSKLKQLLLHVLSGV